MPTPYDDYKKSADKLLAAALALSQTKAQPDGPGVLELPGLLAKLRAAAEDLAAVKAAHEAEVNGSNRATACRPLLTVRAGSIPRSKSRYVAPPVSSVAIALLEAA